MGREFLVDFGQDLARGLQLKLVVAVDGALEDGSSVIDLSGLSFARTHDDIEAVYLVDLKGEFLYLLVCLRTVDDNVVGVEAVVFNLVAEHTLERLYVESLSDLLDDVGYIGVGLTRTDKANGTFGGVISGADDVRQPSSGWSGLSNDPAVGSQRGESVNVNTKLPKHSQNPKSKLTKFTINPNYAD